MDSHNFDEYMKALGRYGAVRAAVLHRPLKIKKLKSETPPPPAPRCRFGIRRGGGGLGGLCFSRVNVMGGGGRGLCESRPAGQRLRRKKGQTPPADKTANKHEQKRSLCRSGKKLKAREVEAIATRSAALPNWGFLVPEVREGTELLLGGGHAPMDDLGIRAQAKQKVEWGNLYLDVWQKKKKSENPHV